MGNFYHHLGLVRHISWGEGRIAVYSSSGRISPGTRQSFVTLPCRKDESPPYTLITHPGTDTESGLSENEAHGQFTEEGTWGSNRAFVFEIYAWRVVYGSSNCVTHHLY